MSNNKVCVSIGATNLDELTSKISKAIKYNPDFLEIRIDYLSEINIINLKKILNQQIKNIIITLKSKKEGGLYKGTEKQKVNLIYELITLSPKFIDVELETLIKNKSLIRKAKEHTTKILASWHDFKSTPNHKKLKNETNEILMSKEIIEKAKIADTIKIVSLANAIEDNINMLKLYSEYPDIKLIAFCMGDKGVISRILCNRMGALFSYVSLPNENLAPGQLSIKELRMLQDFV